MKISKKIRLTKNFILSKLFFRRFPFWIDFKLTDKCNLRCKYCNLWERGLPELSTSEVKQLVDEVEKDCCFIYLSGGEPLLRKDIGEIISHINAKDGIFQIVFTNGTLVQARINDIKEADLINISLDGPEEIHDEIRGKGTFRRVVQAIKVLKRKGIPVSIECVITNRNVNNLDFITSFAKEHQLFCTFTPFHQYTYGGKSRNGLNFSREDFLKATDFLLKEKKNNPWIISSENTLNYWKSWPNQPKSYRCYSGSLYCNINPNGDVTPCFKRTAEPVLRSKSFMTDFFQLKLQKHRCKDCFFGNQLEYSLSSLSSIRHFMKIIKSIKGN